MTSPKDEEEISDISNSHNLTVADDKYRPIPEFYAGRSIFITGGTGFLGKILIEKLLRSCPDIKKIYVLIRPRRGKHIEERLSDLLSTPLFQVIRRENPKQLDKVLPISGDIALEELGISKSDQDMLSEDVSIVFHSAATVRFDEKIKLAVTINMLGTKRLVELCHRMKSLDALIHVSTAYCNCDRAEVSEIIYPAPFNPENIISLMNLLPEDILDELTPTLLGTRPNTYTLTKALAEHIILKEAGNLPVAFVRPSIVISTVKEPFPGWVDNLNGPLGLVAAMSKGLIRTMICQGSNIADVVPADIVINLMITAAWRTASEKKEKPCIYNCSSGYTHSITWNEFVEYALKYVRKHPMERCFWYPSGVLRSNRFLNATHGFLVHYIPSYILDKAAQMAGRKTFMLRIQDKIAKAIECLQYFATHQWLFKDDNVRSLLTKMNENDRDNFDFDVKAINWEKYMEECVLGLRQFFFKEQPESLPESRKRMTRLHYLHEMTKALMVTLGVGLAIAQWKRWQE